MKTNRSIVKMVSAMLASVVLAATLLTGCVVNDGKVRLEEFQNDAGEFQYQTAEWNASSGVAGRELPFNIWTVPGTQKDDELIRYFANKEKGPTATMLGMETSAFFEFYDDQLKLVSFTPQFEEGKGDEVFDDLYERLTKLYGPETKKDDKEMNGVKSSIRRWETKETAMQLTKSDMGTGETKTVMISLSHLSVLGDRCREIVKNYGKGK